jgi:hypothetical protein
MLFVIIVVTQMSEILLFIFLKNNAHNPFPSGLVYFSGVEDQVFLKQKLNIRNFLFLTPVNVLMKNT